jgi:hypothetical protein
MSCVICANLEQAYQAELSQYIEARSSASYRVSTRTAAQKNVDMERARHELEEHRKVCLAAAAASVSGIMPERIVEERIIAYGISAESSKRSREYIQLVGLRVGERQIGNCTTTEQGRRA